jgi:hypothetical protein
MQLQLGNYWISGKVWQYCAMLSSQISLEVVLKINHAKTMNKRHYENKTNNCVCGIFIYVENLLHVSATFCSHRQGDVLRMVCYKEISNNVHKVLSFK